MTNFEYILSMKRNDFDLLTMFLSDLIYDEYKHHYEEDESTLEFVENWLNKNYLD